MHPDTLVDIPPNLMSDWMVLLRPEGERCLAVLKNNTLTLRCRNGSIFSHEYILDPFSHLSRFDVDAILDSVFDTNSNHLYIFDVLLFNQNELVNSDFDFRQFFLDQNWPFQIGLAPTVFDTTEDVPKIVRLKAHQVSRATLSSLYDSTDYEKDSLVFYSKTGKYENGLSCEAFFFRDEHLSKYAIDSKNEEGFAGETDMDLVLIVCIKGGKVELKTWDRISVLEFSTEQDAVSGGIPKPLLKDKTRIRTSLNIASFSFSQFSATRKPFATSFNRIVDQVRKRVAKTTRTENLPAVFQSSPTSFTDILNATIV
jgi:hypothetical protein